jgi:antitoxin (DNA-binding transcriptional repressor) of toxin-antitoxin stability system
MTTLHCMKTMTVSDFKAHALQTINRVNTEHQMIVLTKWGNPVAELRPFKSKNDHPIPGKLAAALVDEQDIVTPFGEEEWNAAQ